MAKVNELEENSKLTPIICDEGVTYTYLQVRTGWSSRQVWCGCYC